MIEPDGWLHTGDIAVANDDGYFRIVDRKKDIYIAGGFNVSPAEVEGHLLRDDRLAEVAVIGVPDDRLGEVGVAFVVPRAGSIDLARSRDRVRRASTWRTIRCRIASRSSTRSR